MATTEVPVFNGYELHALTIFQDVLNTLVEEVEQLMTTKPDSFHTHPKYKLLVAVLDNIQENVPSNPDHPDFRQGLMLGKQNTSWRRVKKKALPARYRLFFQFHSNAPKAIIYAWLNDDSTFRKAGAKTDVYNVFEKMLDKGQVPNTWEELYKEANPLKA
ncbi:type II toxin-antitoxin system YhaV family toxin [Vibrio neptunius]|uniref:type II toxin-antitoxin system YhaV family toxin n=1 Tax=Vibrio neptunius TaxID=170651 RepID=UPI00331493F0